VSESSSILLLCNKSRRTSDTSFSRASSPGSATVFLESTLSHWLVSILHLPLFNAFLLVKLKCLTAEMWKNDVLHATIEHVVSMI